MKVNTNPLNLKNLLKRKFILDKPRVLRYQLLNKNGYLIYYHTYACSNRVHIYVTYSQSCKDIDFKERVIHE